MIVRPLPSTDHNWKNGVAIGWSSSFLVDNTPALRSILSTSVTITFCDGQERLVTGMSPGEGNTLVVSVSGAPLDGDTVGWPNEIRIQPTGCNAGSRRYTAYNLNVDKKYNKGIDTSDANCAALAVANVGSAKRILQAGARINFANGEQREVLSVEDCGHFLHVACSGSTLNPNTYGYPNSFYIDGPREEGIRRYACRAPFVNFDVQLDGRVFFCCPLFTNGYALGNIFHDDAIAIWNGEAAKRFRYSVTRGDFENCNNSCFFLSEVRHGKTPGEDSVLVEREQFSSLINDVDDCTLDYMPTSITIQLDESCNLTCKSCRKTKIIKNREESEELRKLLDARIRPLLHNCETIHLMASGEVLASRAMTDFMRSLTAAEFPRLGYGIISNGQLFSREKWNDIFEPNGIPISYMTISIDAANGETYEKLRIGGSWAKLMKNIEFMMVLRESGKIGKVYFNFLVQKENFRQIRDFVRLAKQFGIDALFFQRISFEMDLNYTDDEKLDIDVCSPDHPNYGDVVKIFADLQNVDGITLYNNCF